MGGIVGPSASPRTGRWRAAVTGLPRRRASVLRIPSPRARPMSQTPTDDELMRRLHRDLRDDLDRRSSWSSRTAISTRWPLRGPAEHRWRRAVAPALLPRAAAPAGRAGAAAGLGGGNASTRSSSCSRGDAAGKGRRDQAHHPAPESACLPGRRCRRPTTANAPSGISSAMSAPARRRRDRAVRDRSWYNRAGVERVMGFCTDDQYEGVLPLPRRSSSAYAGALRHPGHQVLVLDLGRRAARALPGAHPRPAEAVEAQPDGPGIAFRRWEDYTKAKEDAT